MRKGFTIIELMVVIVIISILVAIAVPQYFNVVRRARRMEVQTLLKKAGEVLSLYNQTMGSQYPAAFNGATSDYVDIDTDGDGNDDVRIYLKSNRYYLYYPGSQPYINANRLNNNLNIAYYNYDTHTFSINNSGL